jgi:hypothetical protein
VKRSLADPTTPFRARATLLRPKISSVEIFFAIVRLAAGRSTIEPREDDLVQIICAWTMCVKAVAAALAAA